MATYQVRGILLRHADTRDVDRLISLYSSEQGKIVVIARGLRKISSKLAGSLEPLSEAQVSIVQGARIDTVIGVEPLQTFRRLRTDPERLAVAQYCTALVDTLTRERQRDHRIYQLVLTILQTLNDTEALAVRQLLMIRWYCIWRLMQYLGHQPELRQCLQCRQSLSAASCHFSPRRGGMVHTAHHERGSLSVSVSSLKLLRYIYDHTLAECLAVTFRTPVAQELEPIAITYLQHIAEGDFSFAPFITD